MRPARDPAERGIVLSRDPGAYATERGVKMADEEADQERLSGGGGGCVAELQRLGERLQELERQLRESRVPAVEAATEYCQQLCQVRAPGVPSPFPLLEGEGERAPGGRAGVVAALAPSAPPPGRERGGRGGRLCAAALVAAVCGSRRGEGTCGRGGKSPSPALPRTRGCTVSGAEEMSTAKMGALSAAGRGQAGKWKPGCRFPSLIVR